MLHGIRVLDRSTNIAGPYCGKLLADAGADVTKIEPDGGDPLRRWRSGKLHDFLNESKRPASRHDGGDFDVVILDEVVDPASVRAASPEAVVVTITPWGCTGPWVGRPATEFTLQAWAGSTGTRGVPGSEPISVGGRLGEWIAGTYAGVGAIAALRTGRAVHVDVAMLDCIAMTMTMMPSIFASMSGWHPAVWNTRSMEVPSIEPAADGYVNFTTNSAQQFSDFCVMIGQADLLEREPKMAMAGVRFARREEFEALVHAYSTARTTAEILEEAAMFRVPTGPALNGETVLAFPQFIARGVFEEHDGYRAPRVPYRITPPPPPVLSVPATQK